MADFNALKKKRGLGTPPPAEDTKGNLDKPETAPAAEKPKRKTKATKTAKTVEPTAGVGRPKSTRTAKLSTSLTPEFKKQLRMLSVTLEKDMGEIIEEAVKYWEKETQK